MCPFGRKEKKENYRLFSLDRVDVHFGARIGEFSIKVEHIVIVHVLPHRSLLQHLLGRACKTLQRPLQLRIICVVL